VNAWRLVFEQDLPAVEQMQIGRASPGYDGGVFSPAMDAATHHFHSWVANRLVEQIQPQSSTTAAVATRSLT